MGPRLEKSVAERTVLGTMIQFPNWIDIVAGQVSDDDFSEERNKQVFRAIMEVREVLSSGVDYEVCYPQLIAACKKNGYDDKHMDSYLVEMTRWAITKRRTEESIEALVGWGVIRRCIREGERIKREASQKGFYPTSDRQEEYKERLTKTFSTQRSSKATVKFGDAVKMAFDDVAKTYESGEPAFGITSGFQELDDLTGGWGCDGEYDYVVIGGRPAMGKTALAMAMVINAARSGVPCHIFSSEMTWKQLGKRGLGSEARITRDSMQRGTITSDDWAMLIAATDHLMELPVWLTDSTGWSVGQICSEARLHAVRHGTPGIIMVDYLQIVRPDRVEGNGDREMKQISNKFMHLAKDMRTCLFAVSQLNRSLENRQDKRPIQADLRDSGSLEQDATRIVFVYRDEVYNPESPDKGTAELILKKNKFGPIGTARLKWTPEFTRFDPLDDFA